MEEQLDASRPDPLSGILLPVDDIDTFRRAARVTGALLRAMDQSPQQIDLLHVVTGTFLGELMRGLDLASGETPAAVEMNKLRSRHLANAVAPLLEICGELLKLEMGREPSRNIIKDGNPVKIISSIWEDHNYSSLVISRRNLAEQSDKLIGSIAAGVLHRSIQGTIYLVGDRAPIETTTLLSRCLIAVDDSPASMNSVAEAGGILARANDRVDQIYLVHVLDQSCYYDEDGENCMDASLTGQKALEASGNLLVDLGVDRQKIKTVIHFGKPGTILAEEVRDCDATLVFLGRRDRSRMAQVFHGSVCTEIIQNCRDRTLVLAS
ncbi:MAG: universal stress protein [Desulfofustis sp.]|nr:universal stress protein [Desulfofustis sp.]